MPAAVITDTFWRRALGGDPVILQRAIQLNGSAFTIVGVTAPGFYGMSKGGPFFKPSDVLLPLSAEPLVYTRSTPRALFNADDRWWVQVMARVKPGAPTARLQAALNTTFRSSLAASSIPSLHDANAGEVRIFPASRGLDSWTRGLRQPLLMLGTVVGVVLLIACVNVGNLMLVRGVARQKELSIRLALGSSRWRLVIANRRDREPLPHARVEAVLLHRRDDARFGERARFAQADPSTLGIEAGRRHQATPTRVNAHAISDLIFPERSLSAGP